MQKDIADKLGISVSTVSRALTDNPRISPEVRQKVQQLAASLGYSSRRLPQKENINKLPVTVHVFLKASTQESARAGFIMEMLSGISKAAHKFGMTISLHHFASDEDVQDRSNGSLKALINGGNGPQAGIFLLGIPGDIVKNISKMIPCVSINHRYPEYAISTIRSSEEVDVERMLNFMRKKGHERIGFITTEPMNPLGLSRYSGYLAFLSRNAIEYDNELAINVFKRDMPEYGFAQQLMELSKKKKVTAWMFSTGHQAYTFYNELKGLGVSVPEDISIAGYDHLRDASEFKIGGIQPRYDLIMEEALRTLSSSITSNDSALRNIDIGGIIIEGDSLRDIS